MVTKGIDKIVNSGGYLDEKAYEQIDKKVEKELEGINLGDKYNEEFWLTLA